MKKKLIAPNLTLFDLSMNEPLFAPEEVLEGLLASEKRLSSKFFYDQVGSDLFQKITELPEYYLTKAEIEILYENLEEISDLVGEDAALIEFGSGPPLKSRMLMKAINPSVYLPLDISKDYLLETSRKLASEFSSPKIKAICVDYTKAFEFPFDLAKKRIGCFLGSSIGNFNKLKALDFLKRTKKCLGDGGELLLGVDMKKSAEILNKAYNDSAGITEKFNLNILSHINKLCVAEFDPINFAHLAAYDENLGCVQMHLVSEVDQKINVMNTEIALSKEEKIHTEDSYKYSPSEIESLAMEAGFNKSVSWFDSKEYFGLFYFS